MECLTEFFLIALPFFVLGYITGKIQNELDSLFLREISLAEEEDEKSVLQYTEEKAERLREMEKEIHDITKKQVDNQAFSSAHKKYVTTSELYAGVSLCAEPTEDERIIELKKEIQDFFQEICGCTLSDASEYVAKYGYILSPILTGNVFLPRLKSKEKPRSDEFLKTKNLAIRTTLENIPMDKDNKKSGKLNHKKEYYIVSVDDFSYNL